MMANEEAWLLGKAIRLTDPELLLIPGPVPQPARMKRSTTPPTGSKRFASKAKRFPTPPACGESSKSLAGRQPHLRKPSRASGMRFKSSRAAGSSADIYRTGFRPTCRNSSSRLPRRAGHSPQCPNRTGGCASAGGGVGGKRWVVGKLSGQDSALPGCRAAAERSEARRRCLLLICSDRSGLQANAQQAHPHGNGRAVRRGAYYRRGRRIEAGRRSS